MAYYPCVELPRTITGKNRRCGNSLVSVAVAVLVPVGVTVGVLVRVGVGLSVRVAVGVGWPVAVVVRVGLGTCVWVAVRVGVGVRVGVAVRVGVRVTPPAVQISRDTSSTYIPVAPPHPVL